MGLGRISEQLARTRSACSSVRPVCGMWLFLAAGNIIMGLATIWYGIEPKGQNLEELFPRKAPPAPIGKEPQRLSSN